MVRQGLSELPVEAFLVLSDHFFPHGKGHAKGHRRFSLREQRVTRDDPLDKYICNVLKRGLGDGTTVKESPEPFVDPDMVVYRAAMCAGASRAELATSEQSIFGMEVKKLKRTGSSNIARASGLDNNTTPPSGLLQVYDTDISAITIKAYYLFVCQESVKVQQHLHRLSALVLCDGKVLNEGFEFDLETTGRRAKQIELGSYSDGTNRVRPILVFPNPLSATVLDHQSTLIHARDDLEEDYGELIKVGVIERNVRPQENEVIRKYFCYRMRNYETNTNTIYSVKDPFKPPRLSAKTTQLGRFVVPVKTVA